MPAFSIKYLEEKNIFDGLDEDNNDEKIENIIDNTIKNNH